MEKVKTIKLRFYTDAGHGWLRISRSDARFLGILDRISDFSYQSKGGNTLYLEEDCDAPLVTDAILQRRDCLTQYLPDRYAKNSPIRRLPRYKKPLTLHSVAEQLGVFQLITVK